MRPCPNCNGSHRPTCVTGIRDDRVFLADGTQVVLRGGSLKVVPQEIRIVRKGRRSAR